MQWDQIFEAWGPELLTMLGFASIVVFAPNKGAERRLGRTSKWCQSKACTSPCCAR
jgi:hypothetical protein